VLASEIKFRKYKGLNEMHAQTIVYSEGQNHLEEQLFVGSKGNQPRPLLLDTVLVGVLQ
jgi:hypothetical protein